MTTIENGNIIGEFDLYDYGLPTKKAYLYHQLTNGGNEGNRFPKNREYLRIIGFTKDNQIIEYGFIYFMFHKTQEGLPLSQFIGSKVFDEYRNKGLGDLLMSIYLYYSYDKGFTIVESITRQRKLDILSLMNKYGFRVKNPSNYNEGERISLFRNNMVVDIYKQNIGGTFYQFKTSKAENIYKKNNYKIANNYQFLPSKENNSNLDGYEKLGWIVPNEEYLRTQEDNNIIHDHLDKSSFSK